jgi:uncharacterized protein YdeI (YjbR/CyaY-like superfamily)
MVARKTTTRTTGSKRTSTLRRPRQRMPSDIRAALETRGLMETYRQRPAYQRNDYLGWIARAVRPETKQKRLAQMLDELARGGLYMAMRWSQAPRGL